MEGQVPTNKRLNASGAPRAHLPAGLPLGTPSGCSTSIFSVSLTRDLEKQDGARTRRKNETPMWGSWGRAEANTRPSASRKDEGVGERPGSESPLGLWAWARAGPLGLSFPVKRERDIGVHTSWGLSIRRQKWVRASRAGSSCQQSRQERVTEPL